MKKFLSLVTFILLTLVLVACRKDIKIPENLKITNDILTWDEITNSDKYYVVINEDEHETSSNEYNLKTLELSPGSYDVGVKVVIGKNESKLSKTIKYTVELIVASPKNVKLEGSVVSWDIVAGANQYIVFVNDEQHRQTTNSMDLKTLNLDAGNYEIRIKAVIDTKTSIFSESLNYLVLHELDEEGKTKLLKVLNPYFKANMAESDFSIPSQYKSYLLGVDFVDTYVLSASYNNVSSGNLYNLFEKIFEVLNNENIINNFTDFTIVMGELEELGLTGNLLGTLSVTLSTQQLKEVLSQNEYQLTYLTSLLSYTKDEIDIKKAGSEYNAIKDTLVKYAITDDEKAALDEFFNTTDGKVFWEIEYILNEFYYNLEFEYYNSNDIFYKNVVSVIKKLRNADNDDFSVVYNSVYVLSEIGSTYYSLDSYKNQIYTLEQQIRLSNGALEIFENDNENIVLAFESLFDFVTLTTKTLSSDEFITIVNKLVTGEQLTITEIVLLKDVMIPIFRKSIPSKESLEQVYKTFVTLSGDLTEVNVDDLMNYASFMAELNTISFEVILDFLDLIDTKYLTEIQNILSSEYNYSYAIIDVLLYTVDTYEEFFENTKVKYAQVLTDERLKEIHVMMFNIIIENAKEFSSEVDITILEIIRDNYDLLSSLSKGFDNKLIPLIKSFRNLIDINVGLYGNEPSESYDKLVVELLNLDSILFGELSEESLDPIIDLIALLVDIDLNDYSVEVESLIDIVIKLNNFKTKVLTEASLLNAKDYFEHEGLATGDYKESQYKSLYYITTALNNTLNQTTKDELTGLVNSLFDDILSNDEVKAYFGFDNEYLAELKDNSIDQLNEIYDMVNEVATYDYNSLTDDEWAVLENLVDSIFGNPIPPYNFDDAILVNISETDQFVVNLSDEPAVYELVYNDVDFYIINGEFLSDYISYEIFVLDNGYYESYSYNEVINQFDDYIYSNQEKYYIVFNNISDTEIIDFTLKFFKG